MRKTIACLLATMITGATLASAQIVVGKGEPFYVSKQSRVVDMTAQQFEKIKQKEVVFVLPDGAYAQETAFQTALQSAWTLTPFQIIKREAIGAYVQDTTKEYLFFHLNVEVEHDINGKTYVHQKGENPAYIYYSYDLSEFKRVAKSFEPNKTYARIYLNVNMPAAPVLNNIKAVRAWRETLYKEGKIANFSPKMLQLEIKIVQQAIQKKQSIGFEDRMYQQAPVTDLRKDTLLIISDAFPNSTVRANFIKKYPYPYRWVESRDLQEGVLENGTWLQLVTGPFGWVYNIYAPAHKSFIYRSTGTKVLNNKSISPLVKTIKQGH